MTANRHDVVVFIQLSQPIAQATDQRINCLLRNALPPRPRPHSLDNVIAAADRAVGIIQHLQ